MNVIDLRVLLVNIPEDAVVYVEAAHGQLPEHCGGVSFTTADREDLEFHGDELNWFDIAELEEGDIITAIKIF